MRVLLNYFVPTCSWLNLATCAVVFTVLIQACFEIVTTSLWRLFMVGLIMVSCALCWAVYLLCTNYQRFVAWLTSLYNACSTASMLFNALATCFGCVQWPFNTVYDWVFRKSTTSDTTSWFSTLFNGWSVRGTSASGVDMDEIKRVVIEQASALIEKEHILNKKQVDGLSHELQRQRQLVEDQLRTALAQYNELDWNAKQTPPTLSSKTTISPKPCVKETPVNKTNESDKDPTTEDVNSLSPKACFKHMYVAMSGFPLPPIVEKTLSENDIIKHIKLVDLLKNSILDYKDL